MIETTTDTIIASFPEVHPLAKMTITFQRTLRIPDDDKAYPLPPGLGQFPLRHVDDYAARVLKSWLERGGVILPMYQSEALWIRFSSQYIENRQGSYPFAVKVATGKVNAVSGQGWGEGLHRNPQDYVVVPDQPWLDGFCVEKGYIRQFVAMPLGEGYTVEEQVTGKTEFGGLQIQAYPMKGEVFETRFPVIPEDELRRQRSVTCDFMFSSVLGAIGMGLAAGGRMKQEIYKDRYDAGDWDTAHTSRCYVHLANSITWRKITGEAPPYPPVTARTYAQHGLPWFDYYAEDAQAVEGSKTLAKVKSVFALGKEKGNPNFSDDEAVEVGPVINIEGNAAGERFTGDIGPDGNLKPEY